MGEVAVDGGEACLPITESRNGTVFRCVCHLLSSGIGYQALLLPVAFASLGWTWRVLCLSLAFVWQLYTIWLLVHLHESASGARHSRFLHLSITAFGGKLGKALGIFPVMYLSGGSSTVLIITGGRAMQALYDTMCGDGAMCQSMSLNDVQWFLVFTFIAVMIAQLPNLNSIAVVSLIGATAAIGYVTLICAMSILKGRPGATTYNRPAAGKSEVEVIHDVLNGIELIALSFRGHNLVLEIQVPVASGGLLLAFSELRGRATSKYVLYMLVIVNSLSSFPIHAMPALDNLEMRYIAMKEQKCPTLVRIGLRVFFGGIVFFVAVAVPFLGKLTGVLGGMALPLTYTYPCFMWVALKKPLRNGAMWYLNLALGCLGVVLSVVLVIGALWTIVDRGLDANFFSP